MALDSWRIWTKAEKYYSANFLIIFYFLELSIFFLNFTDLFGYLFFIKDKFWRNNFKFWLWDKYSWIKNSIFAAYMTFYFEYRISHTRFTPLNITKIFSLKFKILPDKLALCTHDACFTVSSLWSLYVLSPSHPNAPVIWYN